MEIIIRIEFGWFICQTMNWNLTTVKNGSKEYNQNRGVPLGHFNCLFSTFL